MKFPYDQDAAGFLRQLATNLALECVRANRDGRTHVTMTVPFASRLSEIASHAAQNLGGPSGSTGPRPVDETGSEVTQDRD